MVDLTDADAAQERIHGEEFQREYTEAVQALQVGIPRLRVRCFRWMMPIPRRVEWLFAPLGDGEFEIKIFVGKRGRGKTLQLAWEGVKWMRVKNRDGSDAVRVFANFHLCDPLSGREAEFLNDVADMQDLAEEALATGVPVVFLLDEIQTILNSRYWADVDAKFLALLAMSRHYGVGIYGAVQHEARMDKALRELVDVYILCSRFKLWRFPLFGGKRAEPESIEGYRTGAKGLTWYRWAPWWLRHAYSTKEIVSVTDWKGQKDAGRSPKRSEGAPAS